LSLWAQITFIFFFQAEDGIRVFHVTGVQTCALPISAHRAPSQSVSELGVCIRIIRGVARGHSARSPCPETGAEREYAMELNSKPRKGGRGGLHRWCLNLFCALVFLFLVAPLLIVFPI